MNFNAVEFLENLFGLLPTPVAPAIMPSPLAASLMTNEDRLPASDPVADSIFADGEWVWRSDHAGVLCLERPGIPEADRWWARCSFDDLPVVGSGPLE
ncbi:MAG: hypothetical protein IT426_20740 [Pirellulales bacterium]|nr:hypothetical protein [Pirellulales bacterium]